ncbi:Lrp/AsnC family transcriptional regulator [Ramlibacter henchirensis]|uniref:Lrp/AsnC family transcriptional regulator n=1 Tax=Ramlibacter henchirensis TaxID=204072 RepID=A0A4Z0C6F6_9BURK|nr:Lrp/AsnC family transcriptional regulator [Ramlibacter henchirensis]TFZ05948.1 Lrp/AsnC family transcriptional regulator [Ramlibacter henchirensis]
MSAPALDLKDRRIIQALLENARVSFSQIGRCIGLSQPAVSERVRRLERLGVITGYGARVNNAALGLDVQVIIRVRTQFGHAPACLDLCARLPQVLDVYKVTGEDSFVLRCAFAGPGELDQVVTKFALYGLVTTSVVLAHAISRPPRLTRDAS